MIVISQDQGTTLLEYGEAQLNAVVTGSALPPPPRLALLDKEYGAFATLRTGENLRGCIGNFAGSGALRTILPRVVKDAAIRDSRFPPLTAAELPEVSLSLSILSPAEPVAGYERIELGRHGVVLSIGTKRAVFLPEVAVEQAWDLPTTLDMLARKAGAPVGSWRGPEARFAVFETIKIGRHTEANCTGVVVETSGGRIEGCAEPGEIEP